AKCKKCGYEVTPLKKWLHMGPPLCPKHTTEMEPIGDWEEAITTSNEK
ncbi:M48 family peptidase, partial [bacterium]|nr:M48 family peptidase [bacterium]